MTLESAHQVAGLAESGEFHGPPRRPLDVQ